MNSAGDPARSLLASNISVDPDRSGAGPIKGLGAVVLAAGEGRRLRPLTGSLAKPLMPVLDRPLLYWTALRLAAVGVEHAVCNALYRSQQIIDAAAHIEAQTPLRVDVTVEDELTGPAGGLVSCRENLGVVDDVLVVSGDAWFEFDLATLLEAHRTTGASITVAATRVANPELFGVLVVEGTRILRFEEKPPSPPPDSLVSCGIYVVSGHLLRNLRPDPIPFDFHHIIRSLLANGQAAHAHCVSGFWNDVGSVEALLSVNLRALSQLGPWANTNTNTINDALGGSWRVEDRSFVGSGARVSEAARLKGSIVGRDASVGPGSYLEECLVFPGFAVPADLGTVSDRVFGGKQ